MQLSADTVDSFTLINADTDLPIAGYDPFLDGASLNLATLPTQNLNVRANTTPANNGSVRFQLNGNNNYRTENAPPYALEGDNANGYSAWTPAVGQSTLTATAYTADNAGGTAGAPLTIQFTVLNQAASQPPAVSITAPSDASSFVPPATILIEATASDPDGSVTQVEFFAGATSLGIDSSAPYVWNWTDVPAGNYSLSAVATDNENHVTTSTHVNISVGTPPAQVKDTKFLPGRGFFDSPFDLTITSATPGASIVYTTDGSEPTETHGTLYSGPIPISTTATIRAFAYKTGETSTNIDTHSFVFVNDVIQQPANIAGYPNNTYALHNGGTTAVHDYEMDPAIVNAAAYSSGMAQSMKDIPTLSIVVDPDEIFTNAGFYDGTDVEKKVSVEVLYPDAPTQHEQAEAGIESHSHQRMKRSLRLNFRSEYGDAKFNTELFRNFVMNGDSASNQLDRIILRAGNNRSWARIFSKEKTSYVIDEFARQSQISTSGHGVHGAFVHLYINGLYWGLYNPVERPDKAFQAEHFGGEAEDWFSLNHGGDLSGIDDRYDYLAGDLKDKDMSNAVNYAELQAYLDIDAFIDYLIVHWYTATGDWPQNNWYGGNRNPSSPLGAGPHRYYLWDGEWSWDLPHASANNPSPYDPWVHPDFRSGDDKDGSASKTIANIFNSAKDSPEFMKQFSDRVYEHLYNDGALTDSAALGRWTLLSNHIREAVVAESARWGDTVPGDPTRTRDGDWQSEVNSIAGLISGRAAKLVTALRAEGYYPDIDPPVYNQHGGTFIPGFQLSITNPNPAGSIHYTLDSSDPTSSSPTYSSPILLTESTEIRARIIDGATVSADHRVTFLLADPPALRITEIMYHPLDPDDSEILAGFTDKNDFEYLELTNVGSTSIDLEGMQFTNGIDYSFGDTQLPAGASILLVSNTAAFEERYGNTLPVLGAYTGKLSNSGETLRLATAFDQTIHEFRYEDTWYGETDGGGFSLNIVDPNTAHSTHGSSEAWFGGLTSHGTPSSSEIISGDLDDPDEDGVNNLLELAMGMNRLVNDAHLLPRAKVEGNQFVYSFDIETAYKLILYEVKTSSDLITWTPLSDELLSTSGTLESREAKIPLSQGQGYIRLEVTRESE